jgi:hypothetical protein
VPDLRRPRSQGLRGTHSDRSLHGEATFNVATDWVCASLRGAWGPRRGMLDVARWLAEQGLEQYAEAFAENAIDGELLRTLSLSVGEKDSN